MYAIIVNILLKCFVIKYFVNFYYVTLQERQEGGARMLIQMTGGTYCEI